MQKIILRKINYGIKNGGGTENSEIKTVNGIGKTSNYFDRWFRHIMAMEAILKQFGIKGYFFLQPWLGSKKKISPSESAFKLVKSFSKTKECMDELYEGFETNELDRNYNNIYCLSDIFNDAENDIYMDNCHVYEQGNQVIAREIYKRIPELHC